MNATKLLVYQYACMMRHDYPGGFSLNLNAGTVEAHNQQEAVGVMLELVNAANAKDGKHWFLYSHVITPIKPATVRRALELIEASEKEKDAAARPAHPKGGE